MCKLEQVFHKVIKKYKLKNVSLKFDKNHKVFDKHSNCEALFVVYSDGTSSVIMKHKRFNALQIQMMLHEIGHAIQLKESRFIVPNNHTRKKYALELEAELFAMSIYKKCYEKQLGKQDKFMLANYPCYKGFFLKKRQRSKHMDNITSCEFANFVKKLDTATKKPIVKLLQEFSPYVLSFPIVAS